jgi:hypothetical protein
LFTHLLLFENAKTRIQGTATATASALSPWEWNLVPSIENRTLRTFRMMFGTLKDSGTR